MYYDIIVHVYICCELGKELKINFLMVLILATYFNSAPLIRNILLANYAYNTCGVCVSKKSLVLIKIYWRRDKRFGSEF